VRGTDAAIDSSRGAEETLDKSLVDVRVPTKAQQASKK